MDNDHNLQNPFKLVQIVRSAQYGGVENHVFQLCRFAQDNGIKVYLISLVDAPIREDFKNLGIETIALNDSVGWSAKKLLRSLGALVRVLRSIQPDLVHLHGIRPTFVGSLACKFAGVRPVVCTLHGAYSLMAIDSQGDLDRKLLLLAKLFHWLGFSLCDRILVDCNRLIDEVRAVFRGLTWNADKIIARKVRVAHNGIDLAQFNDLAKQRDLRSELGITNAAVVVGTISRLDEPKKGIGCLINAFRAAVQSGIDAHLVITGKGYAREILERRTAELGLDTRVHFLGYWENLLESYRTLDIFVLPSLSEGFPTVNLEAMACGLPVVTTDVGGSAEAVQHGVTGFVISPKDESDMSDAIIRLARDPDLRRVMGARGKTRVQEHFSSRAMSEKIFTVYSEIAKAPAMIRRRSLHPQSSGASDQ